MKQLYQTVKELFQAWQRTKLKFCVFQHQLFVGKLALETPGNAERNICYMDKYHHRQLELIKQIGNKSTQKSNQ